MRPQMTAIRVPSLATNLTLLTVTFDIIYDKQCMQWSLLKGTAQVIARNHLTLNEST